MKIRESGRETLFPLSPVFNFKVMFVSNPFPTSYVTTDETCCNSCSYGHMQNVYHQDIT